LGCSVHVWRNVGRSVRNLLFCIHVQHDQLTFWFFRCSQYRGSTVEFNTCLNLSDPQFVASTKPNAPAQPSPTSPFRPRLGPRPAVQPPAGQLAASGFRPARPKYV
jgi:hypothetical protein